MATTETVECKKCENCGKEIVDDLEVICHISQKKTGEDICWCICNDCKAKFLEYVNLKQK